MLQTTLHAPSFYIVAVAIVPSTYYRSMYIAFLVLVPLTTCYMVYGASSRLDNQHVPIPAEALKKFFNFYYYCCNATAEDL